VLIFHQKLQFCFDVLEVVLEYLDLVSYRTFRVCCAESQNLLYFQHKRWQLMTCSVDNDFITLYTLYVKTINYFLEQFYMHYS